MPVKSNPDDDIAASTLFDGDWLEGTVQLTEAEQNSNYPQVIENRLFFCSLILSASSAKLSLAMPHIWPINLSWIIRCSLAWMRSVEN